MYWPNGACVVPKFLNRFVFHVGVSSSTHCNIADKRWGGYYKRNPTNAISTSTLHYRFMLTNTRKYIAQLTLHGPNALIFICRVSCCSCDTWLTALYNGHSPPLQFFVAALQCLFNISIVMKGRTTSGLNFSSSSCLCHDHLWGTNYIVSRRLERQDML